MPNVNFGVELLKVEGCELQVSGEISLHKNAKQGKKMDGKNMGKEAG